MKAELLFHKRIDYDDGAIVEMVLWRIPKPVSPSTHRLKYSLFYGHPGLREVGHDNRRGKGDHRHFLGVEKPYALSTVDKLMADFWSDVHILRGTQSAMLNSRSAAHLKRKLRASSSTLGTEPSAAKHSTNAIWPLKAGIPYPASLPVRVWNCCV